MLSAGYVYRKKKVKTDSGGTLTMKALHMTAPVRTYKIKKNLYKIYHKFKILQNDYIDPYVTHMDQKA